MAIGLDQAHLRHATWNIEKKRCQRVFDDKALHADQLVLLIVRDVAAYRQAHAKCNT